MTITYERRPVEDRAADAKMAGGPLAILPVGTDADEIAAHLDGTFVLLVRTEAGRFRRRCFLTVKAAENAARRAQDAGHSAVVVLASLTPLYRLEGGTP